MTYHQTKDMYLKKDAKAKDRINGCVWTALSATFLKLSQGIMRKEVFEG